MLVNEIARVVLSYTGLNASVAQTVHWYILTQQGEDDSDVLDRIEAWTTDDWAISWANQASDESQLTTMALDIVNTDGTVDRNIGDVVIARNGADSAEQVSAGVCGLLTAITGTPKVRGRKYIPFGNEGAIADGAWNVNGIAWLGNMAADYVVDLGGMTGGILESGVLSRVLEQFVIFQPVGATDTIPAYQRRRKPNVGS